MHQLGRYTLMRRVGVGGMAEIWKAQVQGPAGFQKTVAIKKILPHLLEDDEFIEMFVEEAKLVARLVHPNIVQVFDFGMAQQTEETGYFIAMEYVAGQNLATIQKKIGETGERMPFEVALYIGIETAKALAHAHAGHAVMDAQGRPQQIVHRDVSPHNVLVSYLGEVKVTDFGIAKVANALNKTSGGILKGKVAYMSPEQAQIKPLDGRSDIFCLGIVLYHLVTGNPLFNGRRTEEIYHKITHFKGLNKNQLVGVPKPVAEVLEIALQADPDLRYQHATAMEVALSQVLGPSGIVEARRALGVLVQKLFPDDYQRERSLEDSSANMPVPDEPTSVSGSIEPFGGATRTSSSPDVQIRERSQDPNKTSVSDSFAVPDAVAPDPMASSQPSMQQRPSPPSPPQKLSTPKRGVGRWVLGGVLLLALGAGVAVGAPQLRNMLQATPTATVASVNPSETPNETTLPTRKPTKVAVSTPRPTPRPTRRRTPRPTRRQTPRPTPAVVAGHGTLTVNARPWVRVLVDGKEATAETPLRELKLESGTHRVTFINPVEKFRETRSVTIQANEETNIFVDVRTGKIKIR